MLVTAAPCAIKGAAFDCLRDAIERRETQRKRGPIVKEGASPARVKRPSAPDLGIDLLRVDVSSYLTLC